MAMDPYNEKNGTSSTSRQFDGGGGRVGTGNQRKHNGRRGKPPNKKGVNPNSNNNKNKNKKKNPTGHPSQKNIDNSNNGNKIDDRKKVPCKFGIECTRKNCKFLHTEPRLIDTQSQPSIPTQTPEKGSKSAPPKMMTVEELEAQYNAPPSIAGVSTHPPAMEMMMTVEEVEARALQQQQQQQQRPNQSHLSNNGIVKDHKTKKSKSTRTNGQGIPARNVSSSGQTNSIQSIKPIHNRDGTVNDGHVQQQDDDNNGSSSSSSSSSSDDEVIVLYDDGTYGTMLVNNSSSIMTSTPATTTNKATKTSNKIMKKMPEQSTTTTTTKMMGKKRHSTKNETPDQTQSSKTYQQHEHPNHRDSSGTGINAKKFVSTQLDTSSSSEDDEVVVVQDGPGSGSGVTRSTNSKKTSMKNKNSKKGKNAVDLPRQHKVVDNSNSSSNDGDNSKAKNGASKADGSNKVLVDHAKQTSQQPVRETATFANSGTSNSDKANPKKNDAKETNRKTDDHHQQQQPAKKQVKDDDDKLNDELEKQAKQREEEEAAQKKRFQAELQRQREVAAKKKAEKKLKKAQKFHQNQAQKQAEDDARSDFWKSQINMELTAISFVVRLSASDFCRQNKGLNFTRDGVQHVGQEKLTHAARQAIYELFDNEIVTAVTIVGTNDGADGRHGTIKYWDGKKNQFCVSVDGKKGGGGSNQQQLKFFKPAHLAARNDPPPSQQHQQQKQGKKKGQQTVPDHKQHNITVHYIHINDLVSGKDLKSLSVDKFSVQLWLSSQSIDDPTSMDTFIDRILADREAEEREAARMAEQFKAEEEAAKKRRAEQRRQAQEAYEERRREYKAEKQRFKEYRKQARRESARRGHFSFGGGHGDDFFYANFGGFGGFHFRFEDFGDDFFEDEDDGYFDDQYEEERQANLEAHADVLGVNVDAPREVIVKQYRRLALKFHPDKYRPEIGMSKDEAEEKFKEIQNAYDALLSSIQDEDD